MRARASKTDVELMMMQIVGCSSVYPAEDQATSGYLLRGNFGSVLIDCGYLIADKIAKYYNIQRLAAVIISHMHPDHCDSLLTLGRFIFEERLKRTHLFLPPQEAEKTHELCNVNYFRAELNRYFNVIEYDSTKALCIDSLQIKMMLTKHPINTYAMRFTELDNSRDLVYTSDTGWFDGLAEFCCGAYLMLVEAGDYPPASSLDEQERWHLTPEEAGQLIQKAEAKKGIITHYDSKYSEQILSMASRMCQRDITLAMEHDEYAI